jgi:predicted peroxiredoxin
MSNHSTEDVLILISCGVNSPNQTYAPFHIATLLASMDANVTLVFVSAARELAKPQVAQQLLIDDKKQNLLYFIKQAKRAGVKLGICEFEAPFEVIEEIELKLSGGELAILILESAKVLSF